MRSTTNWVRGTTALSRLSPEVSPRAKQNRSKLWLKPLRPGRTDRRGICHAALEAVLP